MSLTLLRDAGQSPVLGAALLGLCFAATRSNAPGRTLWIADHAGYGDVPIAVGGGPDGGGSVGH
jgi:hypothetical protein